MQGYEIGLVAAVLAAVLVRFVAPASSPEQLDEPASDRLTPFIFLTLFVGLVVYHQLSDPTWTPHGVDWDTWFQSAIAFTGKVPHPPNRYPAYGFLVSTLHAVTPGPMFVKAQIVSSAATAATGTAIYRLGRCLFGAPAGLAACVLTVTFPFVLRIGGWTSAYPLWVATGLWAIAGTAEAVRTGRLRWWVIAGVGLGGVMASMAKGLALGIGLGGVVLFGILLSGRRLAMHLGCVLAPVAVLVLAYVLYPSPLMTLGALSTAFEDPGSLHVDSTASREASGEDDILSRPPDIATYTTGGYIFGREMGLSTVLDTLRTVRAATSPEQKDDYLNHSREVLPRAFPTVGMATLICVALGPLLALLAIHGRVRTTLVGWAGVCAIVATTLPALQVEFNHRFLLPMYTVVPFLVTAPVGIMLRGRASPWRWLAVLFPLVGLLPGSPWRQMSHIESQLRPVEIRATTSIYVRHELVREFPDIELEVLAPLSAGILALDGLEGRLYPADPRFYHEEVRLDPKRYVLLPGQPENAILAEGPAPGGPFGEGTLPPGEEPPEQAMDLGSLLLERPLIRKYEAAPPLPAVYLLGPVDRDLAGTGSLEGTGEGPTQE